MMKNIIEFNPNTELACFSQTYPKPSVHFLPEWYKKIPPFTLGSKKLKFPIDHGMPNVTLKKCIPFLDAMTSGYMAYLEDDVYVEQVNDQPFIRWRTSEERITWHHPEQFPEFQIPSRYHTMVAKWVNLWLITVPKNYSVLFSHPSNRIDLPFFTLSGLVNSDKYAGPVQFPFLLEKGFEGIIPSGTPVCQLTIIKNEKWKSVVKKYNKKTIYLNDKKFFKTFVGSYKKNFWTRHSYE